MENYIYLVSTAHSGSTLIAFLLGNHPQIATVGELAGRTDYANYPCSCGNLITDCPFWANIKGKLKSKDISVDLRDFDIFIDHRRTYSSMDRIYNHYFSVKQIDVIRDYFFSFNKKRTQWINDTINRGLSLAEAITECYRKDCFLDTTKDLYRLKHLINKLKSRLKVLYITRDCRGVMNSLVRKENQSDHNAIQWWLNSNKSIKRILRNYCSNEQFLQIKYEDLCVNTSEKLREIFQFVGVSPEIPLYNSGDEHNHIIGNAMRKNYNGEVRLDEKWKKELNIHQLSLFEKMAIDMNKRLGYS